MSSTEVPATAQKLDGFVLAPSGFPEARLRGGRLTGDPGSIPGTVWIDLNIMGQQLPQMYPPSKLVEATPERCARHDLCPTCLGFGVIVFSDDPNYSDERCSECRGSGSTKYFVEVSRTPSTVTGRLIPRG